MTFKSVTIWYYSSWLSSDGVQSEVDDSAVTLSPKEISVDVVGETLTYCCRLLDEHTVSVFETTKASTGVRRDATYRLYRTSSSNHMQVTYPTHCIVDQSGRPL